MYDHSLSKETLLHFIIVEQIEIAQINSKEIVVNRRYLAIAGSIYMIWWFAIELILPQAFNPFLSRFSVVLSLFAVLGLSYISIWIQRHLQSLFYAGLWLITLHYYYLFYGNAGDINWVVGSYITVIAVTFCFLSNAALLAYSGFVICLSLILIYLIPTLNTSVFLPGLVTIMAQANIGLRSRLKVIKTLADSNRRFQLLFNSTFEGVLVHENRIILDVNEALAKMLGYSRTELIGKDVLDVLHPRDKELAIEKMKIADVAPYETIGFTKGGSMVDIEVRAKNFEYDKSLARLVTVQEISDRKQAEKERIASMTLAENVRIRDEFISIASHELKTPLSSLKLQTQLIERDIKKNATEYYPIKKVQDLLGIFDRQINRLTELVETMLDVSRISADRFTLEPQSFNFSQLIREISSSLQTPNMNTTFAFQLELPEELMILADPARIRQVVENLLTNAIKYGEGKPIFVKLSEKNQRAELVVQDHGLGIAAEFTHKIFDRFERAISAKNISGLGLGLYITKKIIEAHSGSISVQSTLHEGSTFTVSLPL